MLSIGAFFAHGNVKGARQTAIAKPWLLGDKSPAAAPGGGVFRDKSMRNPKFSALGPKAGLIAALFALTTTPLFAQDDPLLAKVNGVEIHQSDLTVAEEEAGQIPPMSPEAKRDYLVSFMTDMILLSQAAQAQKIGDTPQFKKRAEFVRNKLLMTILLENTGKTALTEEAMRKVYDDAVKQMPQEQEVHARHILIRAAAGDDAASKTAEDKVKAAIERIKKGEDFGKVATEITEDPSGKANGGDLGFFTREQMVPEFAEAAFKLDKGQISEPVKTSFGWHVIKVEDKRTKPAPSYEQVKAQVEQFVTRKAQAELVQKVREGAKVEKFYKSEAETAAPADAPKADEPKK